MNKRLLADFFLENKEEEKEEEEGEGRTAETHKQKRLHVNLI